MEAQCCSCKLWSHQWTLSLSGLQPWAHTWGRSRCSSFFSCYNFDKRWTLWRFKKENCRFRADSMIISSNNNIYKSKLFRFVTTLVLFPYFRKLSPSDGRKFVIMLKISPGITKDESCHELEKTSVTVHSEANCISADQETSSCTKINTFKLDWNLQLST